MSTPLPIVAVAGKNQIAVNALEFLRRDLNIPPERLRTVLNAGADGLPGFQPSFGEHARSLGFAPTPLSALHDLDTLVLVSLEYDRLIDVDAFRSTRLFNVHFSKLPEYKGAYTSALPILHGRTSSGTTLHVIDRGIDTGPIIDQLEFPIEDEDTCRDVYLKYLRYGEELFRRNAERLLAGEYQAIPQPADNSTFYSRTLIDYKNLVIDLKVTGEQLKRQIRAFSFPEYQLPVVHGRRVLRAVITGDRSTLKPGTVVRSDGPTLVVATIDFDVRLETEGHAR